ncbi:GAK system XXXCH domain-containing protein [Paucidesulfovibrio longus]|uniref:GAK system XXXCH domain-containing protein n=1 Tax=Paucidesulfovibrio longus TaxID=889 RepID=UPI0003B561CF|nr:GAK system XXXCH domain-containing protein [Paucidesulfovibrio longus]
MGNSIKMESYLSADKLPDMFRRLADVMEKGAVESGLEALQGVEDFSKIGISVKKEFGRLLFKIKIKCKSEECAVSETGDAEEPLKYKSLKKRMKNSFKLIFTSLGEGVMPPDEAVRSFVRDSELMIGFPGFGDAHYEEYAAATQSFADAYESGDLAATQTACNELDRIKSHCHNRFK